MRNIGTKSPAWGRWAYRRDIKGMRNLQEGRHDLARAAFHGRKGDLRHAYPEGMEDHESPGP